MSLLSLGFLFFCIFTLVVFASLPKRFQAAWLLVISYVFYLTFDWRYALVLALLTILNFFIGIQVEKHPAWRWPGLLLNITSFGSLKILTGPYGLPILVSFFPSLPVEMAGALLPIGFSFYVLQSISYLLDISNKQIKAERNPIHFALYMAWFPKLISGPIERAGIFLPQLGRNQIIDNAGIGRAIGLILTGLVRKMIIADHLAMIRPPELFSQPELFTLPERALWLVVAAVTLYNDFAGYTSMMRGVSLLFGIELSINFRQPFFANTVGEFWNRWHISLSGWLRDYIFYPLQRWMAKRKVNRNIITIATPLITMLASGFWHGAYFTMLGWGGLHGVYLATQQLLKIRPSSRPVIHLGQVFITFLLTTLAWVPFFTTSGRLALGYLFSTPTLLTSDFYPWLLGDIAVLAGLSLWIDLQESRSDNDEYFMAWHPTRQAVAIGMALLLLGLFAGNTTNLNAFVYQGF